MTEGEGEGATFWLGSSVRVRATPRSKGPTKSCLGSKTSSSPVNSFLAHILSEASNRVTATIFGVLTVAMGRERGKIDIPFPNSLVMGCSP